MNAWCVLRMWDAAFSDHFHVNNKHKVSPLPKPPLLRKFAQNSQIRKFCSTLISLFSPLMPL